MIDRNGETLPGNETGLEIQNLTISYMTDSGSLDTVRDVSLTVKTGEIYGLVGESGSGKTTLARGIVQYLPKNGSIKSGTIALDGINLRDLSKKQIRGIWGSKITMVHQNPSTAVNPSLVVGEQIAEMARIHLGMSRSDAKNKALEMLARVRMPDPEMVAMRYPHQLSGGQLQRILIAIALTTNPTLLIMDEPTTALDVTTEAVILDLVRELLPEYRTAVLYITHNLGVVARLCNRVGVIYAGELMEVGPVGRVFNHILHPYTLGLLGSVPRVDKGKQDVFLKTIPGFIPRPDDLPRGCVFGPRCKGFDETCQIKRPSLVETEYGTGHYTACRKWEIIQKNPDAFKNADKKRVQKDGLAGDVVLEANNIVKNFSLSGRGIKDIIRGRRPKVHAVDDVSVRVRKSFTMGIVGESGCGKTTLARCIAGLEKATGGEMILEGQILPYAVNKRSSSALKKIQMVFQNPDASLNPQHTIGASIARPLSLMGSLTKKQIKERVKELLHSVNLPDSYSNRLPHELSGGEKQRVAIARAFATDPALMICDEPISSLDVSVQASLLNLLMELQNTQDTSYLFISHDLASVRYLSHWIAVIYLGRICEIGSASDVFSAPQHPYTEALFSALPIPDPNVEQNRIRLQGSVPSAVDIPSGCRFHTRCPRALGEICSTTEPPWQEAGEWHRIRCHISVEELIQLQKQGKK